MGKDNHDFTSPQVQIGLERKNERRYPKKVSGAKYIGLFAVCVLLLPFFHAPLYPVRWLYWGAIVGIMIIAVVVLFIAIVVSNAKRNRKNQQSKKKNI